MVYFSFSSLRDFSVNWLKCNTGSLLPGWNPSRSFISDMKSSPANPVIEDYQYNSNQNLKNTSSRPSLQSPLYSLPWSFSLHILVQLLSLRSLTVGKRSKLPYTPNTVFSLGKMSPSSSRPNSYNLHLCLMYARHKRLKRIEGRFSHLPHDAKECTLKNEIGVKSRRLRDGYLCN